MAQESPEALLMASDQSRGGVEEGLNWNSEIKTEDNGEITVRKFTVKAKGADALVDATEPLRTKGEVYVFNDKNMWFIKPGLRKPVSISPKAKLTGLASNGDIASTWYARDYSGVIEKTENLNGQPHYVMLLKAKSDGTTYDQIRYWIDQKTKLASKADFLSLQGQVLKTASFKYKNSIKVKGKTIPFISQMFIQDGNRKDYKSLITYSSLKLRKYQTGEFNVNNIRK